MALRSYHRPWIALYAFITVYLLGQAYAADQSPIELERTSNQSLLWGPYRPNLYFGVRPRIPKTLLTGLLWASVEDYQSVQNNFRHTCEQHSGMAGYGWTLYDVRLGGIQEIHDAGNRLDLTTTFIKNADGQNWGVRVKGVPRADAPDDLKTTMFFYVAREGLGSLEITNEQDEKGFEGAVRLRGEVPGLGEFGIEVTEGVEGGMQNRHPVHEHPSFEMKPLDRTLAHSFQLPEEALWQVPPVLFAHMKNNIDRYVEKYGDQNVPPPPQFFTIDNEVGRGNMHIVQKVLEGPFEFDILYSSASTPKAMTSEDITEETKSVTSILSDKFGRTFKPQPPFVKGRYEEFSKSLFSNLLGGIGYFYGDFKVDRSYVSEYEEENEGFWEETAEARARNEVQLEGPAELFTSIPSRPFFPRGFLWDEGFHLLPVLDWDMDLTLDIIKSWFDLIDEDGWIAREQILGPEARSKVPAEFQVQYPHYANPPTLFFVLSSYIDKLQQGVASEDSTSHCADPAVAKAYLKELYPLLKRHYYWFRRTQSGDIKSYDRDAFSTKEAYRWRGRTPQHILPSGLDDYPRAQPPHPGELHLDAISWVGMMSKSLKKIAAYVGEEDDTAEFEGHAEAIARNINDLHWDEKHKMYCDATIDEYEESVHVCHKGYISLFPFMVGLLEPDNPRLGHVLDLIADDEELWSPHGIRSLSKKDEFYGTAENYWRSPVWININYLIVARLLELAQTKGPHQERARKMYTDLRKNLVDTVYKSWKETGFAWEQYSPETGAGQRTQHFTGWTSLVVKIAAMPDLSKVSVRDEL